MSGHTCFLPWYIRDSELVTVTPVLGAFLVSGDFPPLPGLDLQEAPPEGMIPLTFWVDGHAVASRWFGAQDYKEVTSSALFAEPVWLAFVATFPTRTPGWMRVDVSAVGTSDDQVWGLLELHNACPSGVPLVHPGYGRVALPLGHRWVPLPDLIAECVPMDCEETRSIAAAFASETFLRILYGDDEEVAKRVLESIPGIRGERRH
jgi:hypothetical protein